MKKNLIIGIVVICVVGVTLGIVIPLSLLPRALPPKGQEYWETSTPEEQGMDAQLSINLQNYIASKQVNVSCVLVVRNGYIVEEAYYENYMIKEENSFTVGDWVTYQGEGDLHNMWSATKSITSLLIGICLHEGFIDDLNQTIFDEDLFPELWNESCDPRTENITIENLLRMESGIDWHSPITMSPHTNPPFDDPDYLHLEDILYWDLIADPGDPFISMSQYSSDATHVLSCIVNRSTGQYPSDFAQEYLFGPLGISEDDWYWYTDGDGTNLGGSSLCMKPRDMAKLGYLCLNNGTWEGTEILSKEYIEAASTDYPGAMPYGYQFWLGTNYYYASGAYGQSIYVVPNYDIVVVFTADGGTSSQYGEMINTIIIPSIS
ncbi:MAG: serine hydrolase domain-containing protein [Promethearchaeota archaeon]